MEDPYLQGKIACANVLSDVYAMGITRVDNILMILGVSLDMNEGEREIVTRDMIRGFNDQASAAGSSITGGQSVMNPWPMIGGVANTICHVDEIIYPRNGKEGDILVLTKPLGTQPAVNAQQWKSEGDSLYKEALQMVDASVMEKGYEVAAKSMATLNMNAASLMSKYKVNGATDITGFGLIGHLQNLAEAQFEPNLSFQVDTLPIIKGMDKLNFGFKLLEGYSAETSGGLCMMVNESDVDGLQSHLKQEFGQDSWVIGHVKKLKSKPEAKVKKAFKVIEVEDFI